MYVQRQRNARCAAIRTACGFGYCPLSLGLRRGLMFGKELNGEMSVYALIPTKHRPRRSQCKAHNTGGHRRAIPSPLVWSAAPTSSRHRPHNHTQRNATNTTKTHTRLRAATNHAPRSSCGRTSGHSHVAATTFTRVNTHEEVNSCCLLYNTEYCTRPLPRPDAHRGACHHQIVQLHPVTFSVLLVAVQCAAATFRTSLAAMQQAQRLAPYSAMHVSLLKLRMLNGSVSRLLQHLRSRCCSTLR